MMLSFDHLGDILLGIPARPMPFILLNANQTRSLIGRKRAFNDYPSMPYELIKILLFTGCIMLILTTVSSLHTMI